MKKIVFAILFRLIGRAKYTQVNCFNIAQLKFQNVINCYGIYKGSSDNHVTTVGKGGIEDSATTALKPKCTNMP